MAVVDGHQVDLQGRELGCDGLAIHDFQIPQTHTPFVFGDSRVWDLALVSTVRMGRCNIQTTMSTAPYLSNANSKRDSWSSQLVTLHLMAAAFPPSVVIVETTASAPATSKSPITTLALNGESPGLIVDAGFGLVRHTRALRKPRPHPCRYRSRLLRGI
jgi:hypothetical protein